ncbi:hypothetical protein J540_3770 [Acinetobacter baumannii 1440422]|nr:hypothetical protein J540_3770 [Acinetobacter baumannii 1440422]
MAMREEGSMTDFNYEDRIKELELFNKWADFEGLDTKMSSETEHSSKETHLAFLAWIAAKAQAVPEKKIYLTCEQLYAAANFGAPNKDPELLETELTIAWFDEAHSGSGYYVYISEYPEEGAMKLESESGAEK